jgi:hypothetical protein
LQHKKCAHCGKESRYYAPNGQAAHFDIFAQEAWAVCEYRFAAFGCAEKVQSRIAAKIMPSSLFKTMYIFGEVLIDCLNFSQVDKKVTLNRKRAFESIESKKYACKHVSVLG